MVRTGLRERSGGGRTDGIRVKEFEVVTVTVAKNIAADVVAVSEDRKDSGKWVVDYYSVGISEVV